MRYVLYNPLAGNGSCEKETRKWIEGMQDVTPIDLHRITSFQAFFDGLEREDTVVLCGGDGTLNRFANDTKGVDIRNPVYYYAVGSGNDFARELGKKRGDAPDFPINGYLKRLPTVSVNGKKHLFINGVGYGIDGYCCEVGDAMREENQRTHKDKPINYTSIAIKGLLFHYKPTSATVTVDGKEYAFKKVWLAPTMHGKYYGGGMMPTPAQDRASDMLSVMVFHGSGKLRTLTIFPSIFKGEHVRHSKYVTVLEGKEIEISFDSPRPLQIDGETVREVRSYTASTAVSKEASKEKKENVALFV